MNYLSVAETAKKWNISERSVRNYCAQERIPGCLLYTSPRLCGDNLPIFKSKRLHQIGVTPANAGKNCKTLCVSSIPFSRVTHIFK